MRRTIPILAASLALALPAMAGKLQDVAGANYSLDTETGLRWLDVSETAGLSFSQVVHGAGGWLKAGWRYATSREVNRMLRDNLTDLDENWQPAGTGYPGAFYAVEQEQVGTLRPLIDTLGGPTFGGRSADRGLMAFYTRTPVSRPEDVDYTPPTTVHVATLQEQYGWAYVHSTGGDATHWGAAPEVGSFLVSTGTVPPVPEPATYGLMMAGLGVVGWVARGRRQRGGKA